MSSTEISVAEPEEKTVLPNGLPYLVLKKLTTFFDLEELKTVRLVCNQWRMIAEQKVKFIANLTYINVATFLASGQVFQEVLVENLTNSGPIMGMPVPLSTDTYPHVRCLAIIGSSNSEIAVMSLLKFLAQQIKHLKFQMSLENMLPCITSGIASLSTSFALLDELSLEMRFDEDKNLEVVGEFLQKANFQHLEKVSLKCCCPYGNKDLLLIRICMKFYEFLVRHNETLTGLHCDFESNLALSKYPNPFQEMASRNELSKLTNLLNFCFRTKRLEMNDFVRALVNGTTKLKLLAFAQQLNPLEPDLTLLPEVLKNNGKTLKFLVIEFVCFDTDWMEPCTALKVFSIYYERFMLVQNPDDINFDKLVRFRYELFDLHDDQTYHLITYSRTNLTYYIFGEGTRTRGPITNYERLAKIITKKRPKLEHISIHSHSIDFNLFTNCFSLKYLQLGSLEYFILGMKSSASGEYFLPNLVVAHFYDYCVCDHIAAKMLGQNQMVANYMKARSDPSLVPRHLEVVKRSPDLIDVTIQLYAEVEPFNYEAGIFSWKVKTEEPVMMCSFQIETLRGEDPSLDEINITPITPMDP